MMQNAFLHIFFNDFVKAFRRYDQSGYSITINGIEKVIDSKSPSVVSLLEQLRAFGISVVISGGGDSVHSVEIDCVNAANDSTIHSQYYIQNIPSLIELASKTGIPFSCLLIMKVVASVISRLKVLYKAIVLDLDDTLWKGTLSEDGIDVIKENLVSKEGAPFISFMRFLKVLTEELGIFIAVCSRNDNDLVVSAIDELDESLFPIKNQIDCIVANNNNKSDNLSLIAQQLSILPGKAARA